MPRKKKESSELEGADKMIIEAIQTAPNQIFPDCTHNNQEQTSEGIKCNNCGKTL